MTGYTMIEQAAIDNFDEIIASDRATAAWEIVRYAKWVLVLEQEFQYSLFPEFSID